MPDVCSSAILDPLVRQVLRSFQKVETLAVDEFDDEATNPKLSGVRGKFPSDDAKAVRRKSASVVARIGLRWPVSSQESSALQSNDYEGFRAAELGRDLRCR